MDLSPPTHPTHLPQAQETAKGEPWRILLIELINLLGLILTHARHAKGARATAVLFEQIVHRLHVLGKMPGHDGGMIIRRIGNSPRTLYDKPDYYIIFGQRAFRGADAILNSNKLPHNLPHLANALDQAFGCLHEHGIFALYLQLPGNSIEKIDQLRLSLNILARFRGAAENNASITFRYFGRVMTVPLVNDGYGRPDPNLTVLAGLNGLSGANMRELIKQAQALWELARHSDAAAPRNDYNQIFSVRSLRSQLIQPPIEVNNLPWMREDAMDPVELNHPPPDQTADEEKTLPGTTLANALHPSAFDLSPDYLRIYLDSKDQQLEQAIDSLFNYDYTAMDAPALAAYLNRTSLLLTTMEKATSADPLPFERLLSFLHEHLERIPEMLLACLTVQRQAIKIQIRDRTTLVGLVHPRLLDLIVLVKERAVTRHKIAFVSNQTFDLKAGDLKALADLFDIQGLGSEQAYAVLKTCFNQGGKFDRYRFVTHIETLTPFANGIFELLWCLLRHVPGAQDRFALLDVLPLVAERLHTPKMALAFLLSDLFQAPLEVHVSDRNAFGLAIQMLRTHNRERGTKIRSTPEEVLAVRKNLNTTVVQYAAWRLDIDAVRILSKFNAVRDALRRSVLNTEATLPGNELPGFHLLLSLEREGLIFISLVGGKTARMVLRNAFAYYGDPGMEIYQNSLFSPYLPDIMMHLQIVLRGMVRLGEPQDLDRLKYLEQCGAQLMALNADPAFARRVKQTLQWIAPAMRAIQVQLK